MNSSILNDTYTTQKQITSKQIIKFFEKENIEVNFIFIF